jgi:site-specific DNA recombinase
LADPERGWEAIVIGEYERAFYGGQYASMAPLFEHYGIQLWTPEVGGRIDFHADDHEETQSSALQPDSSPEPPDIPAS